MDDATLDFDAIYATIVDSAAYRAAAHELVRVLPEWVVPFGSMTPEDAYRVLAFPLMPGETIVDLGCGLGGPSIWIAGLFGAKLVGVDLSATAIAAANALAESRGVSATTRFIDANGQATRLPGQYAGAVISFDALPFMDAATVAREIARILQPRGYLMCTLTEWTGDEEPPLATMVRSYDPYFEAAGLVIAKRMELDPDRGLPLYRGLLAREAELRAEAGVAAQPLLDFARDQVERPRSTRPVRDVYLEARRPKTTNA